MATGGKASRTGTPASLTESGERVDAWSPDGQNILVVLDGTLYRFDPGSQGLIGVTHGIPGAYSQGYLPTIATHS